MTTCKQIYSFLNQVSARSVTALPLPADLTLLSQLGLVQTFTVDQYHELQNHVQSMGAAQQALSQETMERVTLALEVERETRATHSVLFHFEGKEKKAAEVQHEAQDEAQLRSVDQDLAQKQQQLGQLVAQRSLLDTLTPCGDGYVGLSGLGVVETRNLGVALYRVSDSEFGAYWNQSLRITEELTNLAATGAGYCARLASSIAGADLSHLWAVSIGLSKDQPDVVQGTQTFVRAYDTVRLMTNNIENRLMSAEILCALPGSLQDELPVLSQIQKDVRKLEVPAESALGVSSILLLGRRADGTVATPNLAQFLRVTKSYESAALLAIVNVPLDGLTAKFQSLRRTFTGWGYTPSEDVELSSAYLAVSEIPVEGITTKLAIIAKGLSTYLQYPLVAASVLASLSTLEANETLTLLGRAYDLVGRRATGLAQGELICLAVRMLHGIRDELLRPLDATAAVRPTPSPPPGVYGPRFFFVPIIVAQGAYWSTYSGVGGAHPGHVHGFGGGTGGFVG